MKKLVSIVLILTLGFSLVSCSSWDKVATGDATKNYAQRQIYWQIIEDAYVYTFPLVLMDATATAATNTELATDTKAPINQLIHSKKLADAESKQVVSPNVDTLYTQAFLDLSDDAMVYHKPAADRFLSVELLDYYTNCTAILGTGGDTQDARSYLITGPDWEGQVPEGMVQVPMPTNNAWIIVRTVVNDEADLETVYALQDEMKLVPLQAYKDNGFDYDAPRGSYHEENEYVPIEKVLQMSPQEFFGRANELMLKNPPADTDAYGTSSFELIGVGPGLSFDETGLGADAEETWGDTLGRLWNSELEKASKGYLRGTKTWSYYGEPIAEFGINYRFRALIAYGGLGANPVSVAVYPLAETDFSGMPLTGESAYRIHFEKDALPPTEEYGFWSLTAYGADNFLIDNEIDRYLINDRSDYVFNEDGSLDILVQSSAPEDESLMGNWLPVGEGEFHIHMRIYLPSASVLADEWQYPKLVKVA